MSNKKNNKELKKDINNLNIKMPEKVKLIKEHHLILWFFFFFPVALYKSFKYHILPKWLNVMFICFFSILLIVIVDTIINPNRVVNSKVEIELENYTDELGNVISVEQYDIIENYYIYDVISSLGRFDVYIDSSYKIKAIKQTEYDSKNIYISDDFEEKYKNVYSEIIRFVNNNDISISNNIENILETKTKEQTLKIDGKKYIFKISFENVEVIYDENENLIYKNENPSLKLNKKVFKKVFKKFPQTSNIDYLSNIEFYEDNYVICFHTKEGNIYKIMVYDNGTISVSVATQ